MSIGQKDIENAVITLGDGLVYNTTEQTQSIKSVTVDGLNVTYDISGNTATDAGEYTLTVTANGNFKGEKPQKFTVAPAQLTIKVKDVSREYGTENPELEAEYSGFKNGEDESVLNGELKFSYNGINEQTAVGTYREQTTAWGVTADNYTIQYLKGDVEITKISVNASAGVGRKSYLSVLFDRAVEGLTKDNFTVKDSGDNPVTVTNVIAASDNKSYTLGGTFEIGKEHTVTIVLDNAEADKLHRLKNDKVVITPVSAGGGGGGGATYYTVSFETNGGSKLSSQSAAKNSTVKEPTAPTKDGFEFSGWYTDKELTAKYDFSERVTKSITLYAAWTKKDNSDNRIILTIGEKTAQVFGQTKSNDVAPKVVNDRTMLPARFVAENLGANVEWDGEKHLVTITGKHIKTGEDITILIYIDSDIAYVNGKEIRLDSPAFVENDRTYTPVRFISEELGANVEWLQEELKVVITKEK